MHDLISKYKEAQHAVEPQKKERWEKILLVHPTHTMVEGSVLVNCIECGEETVSMC